MNQKLTEINQKRTKLTRIPQIHKKTNLIICILFSSHRVIDSCEIDREMNYKHAQKMVSIMG